jgi:hypothetical protein
MGDGKADAGRAAGDDGRTVVEIETVHGLSSVVQADRIAIRP